MILSVILGHPRPDSLNRALAEAAAGAGRAAGHQVRFLPGDAGEGTPVGLLRARAALVVNTSNTFAEREARVFGDPLERIWRDCVFGLCGVARVERRTFGVVATSGPEQRRAWLEEVRGMVERLFPAAR